MQITSGLPEKMDSVSNIAPLPPVSITASTEGTLKIQLNATSAAIVATEKETALYVDDTYLQSGQTLPHISKLNLAMLFIDALSKHPNWFERGLKMIESMKAEPGIKG